MLIDTDGDGAADPYDIAWAQRGSDIDGEAANNISGGSVSLSSDGAVVAIGAEWKDGNGSNSCHVRLYKASAD